MDRNTSLCVDRYVWRTPWGIWHLLLSPQLIKPSLRDEDTRTVRSSDLPEVTQLSALRLGFKPAQQGGLPLLFPRIGLQHSPALDSGHISPPSLSLHPSQLFSLHRWTSPNTMSVWSMGPLSLRRKRWDISRDCLVVLVSPILPDSEGPATAGCGREPQLPRGPHRGWRRANVQAARQHLLASQGSLYPLPTPLSTQGWIHMAGLWGWPSDKTAWEEICVVCVHCSLLSQSSLQLTTSVHLLSQPCLSLLFYCACVREACHSEEVAFELPLQVWTFGHQKFLCFRDPPAHTPWWSCRLLSGLLCQS